MWVSDSDALASGDHPALLLPKTQRATDRVQGGTDVVGEVFSTKRKLDDDTVFSLATGLDS